MKLSFSTLGCPNWTFATMIDEAQRLGFTGIEIRGIEGKMRAEEIERFFPENTKSTRELFAGKGLALVGFGTSCKFHDDAAFGANVEEGRLAIDVCARMGFPAIRVFGDRIESDSVREHVVGQVAKGIRILCEYARGKAVDVLLEIHGNFNRLETVMPLIRLVEDCPEFGILWDIEHSDKIYADDWRVFYHGIRPYIRHVHIKDHKRAGGAFELRLVGEGDIPIADIVRTLEADGYNGWYSLEWEKTWHPEIPEPDVALPGYMDYMAKL